MAQQLTIDQRMQAVHERIQLEKQSGISAVDEAEQFLAYCQVHEPELPGQDESDDEDLPDWNGSSWRNFDKWNDAPIFALKRRKARVG